MNNKIALQSLSMDLKRVALGYHRGSTKMADRFIKEAIKREKEIDRKELKLYLRNILEKMEPNLCQDDKEKVSEWSLLVSILCQNYTQRFFK